ncbi:MAG: glutamine synthetase type III, partial [Planctomycetes bacterium]|nr:glutamine synthetase type III [Planctomycetota bacterium]
EQDDHYFGTIHERVASYMNEVNKELWKLGVSAKTQHNEVSPGQYELAPVFATVNIATDHNQLTMETLQKVALRHDFVCLLHEKPFAGVNGSGKHNNWSMVTDDGINLLEPGKTPHDNMVFLVILCAVVKAVDKYSKLLRASVANAGNEHRLGANEAPPAIISIFLGDQLNGIFDQLANGEPKTSKNGGDLKLGVSTLPQLPKDSTDRNRTSPFAFTGNRFEFRMAGSTQSTAGPNFVLNTIVAEILSEIADELEGVKNIKSAVQKLLQKIAKEHGRIVFNGDNYSGEWVEEAEKRGLPNIHSTVESLRTIMDEENVEVFSKHRVLTRAELHARTDILLKGYSMSINIEARTMLDMTRKQILPTAVTYSGKLADSINSISNVGSAVDAQKKMLDKVCGLVNSLYDNVESLEAVTEKVSNMGDIIKQAEKYHEEVIPAMNKVRNDADELEKIIDAEIWPLPTYAEMLFLR